MTIRAKHWAEEWGKERVWLGFASIRNGTFNIEMTENIFGHDMYYKLHCSMSMSHVPENWQRATGSSCLGIFFAPRRFPFLSLKTYCKGMGKVWGFSFAERQIVIWFDVQALIWVAGTEGGYFRWFRPSGFPLIVDQAPSEITCVKFHCNVKLLQIAGMWSKHRCFLVSCDGSGHWASCAWNLAYPGS